MINDQVTAHELERGSCGRFIRTSIRAKGSCRSCRSRRAVPHLSVRAPAYHLSCQPCWRNSPRNLRSPLPPPRPAAPLRRRVPRQKEVALRFGHHASEAHRRAEDLLDGVFGYAEHQRRAFAQLVEEEASRWEWLWAEDQSLSNKRSPHGRVSARKSAGARRLLRMSCSPALPHGEHRVQVRSAAAHRSGQLREGRV